MPITSTSLTVRGQSSPRFHVEAWLPFRNCDMGYLELSFMQIKTNRALRNTARNWRSSWEITDYTPFWGAIAEVGK